MEESTARCPACGARVSERLGGGLCGGCLVALALEQDDADPTYRILAVLDGTDTRTIYLAEDEEARRLVTVDVVRAAAAPAMTPGLFDARLAELVTLRHPGIVPVLGGRITSGGDYYVVSEYIPGRTAAAWGISAIPDPREVASVIERVCGAVRYAHAVHVVHGRLGPSSVVLSARSGGAMPYVGGYGVCEGRPVEDDDVAGLGRVLAALAQRPTLAAGVAPVAERATRARGAGGFASVAEFCEAAMAACGAGL